MPPSKISFAEKSAVWEHLSAILGVLIPVGTKRDWRTTSDRRVSIHVAYGQFLNKQGWYWYGLPVDDIDKATHYEHAFVVFVMDKRTETLVVPLKSIYPCLKDASADSKGNYKMHIYPTYQYEASGTINLRPYRNKFSALDELASKKPQKKANASKRVMRVKR